MAILRRSVPCVPYTIGVWATVLSNCSHRAIRDMHMCTCVQTNPTPVPASTVLTCVVSLRGEVFLSAEQRAGRAECGPRRAHERRSSATIAVCEQSSATTAVNLSSRRDLRAR